MRPLVSTLQYATAKGLKWDSVRDWTEKEVAEKLLPSVAASQTYNCFPFVRRLEGEQAIGRSYDLKFV